MTINLHETGQQIKIKETNWDFYKNQLEKQYGKIRIQRHWHNKSLLFCQVDLGGCYTNVAAISCTKNQAVRLADVIMAY